MEHVTKPLLIAVTVFITAIVISIAVFLSDKSADAGNAFGTRIANINRAIEDNDLLQFDNGFVSGADVVNCIRKYRNTVTINVTKMLSVDTDSTTTYTDLLGPKENLPSNVGAYINPNAQFSGAVTRNANGVISTIDFIQLQYVADAGNGSSAVIPGTPGTPGGGTGGGTLSQSTIAALVQTINGLQAQVTDQVIQQTEAVNDLLEKFMTLQQYVMDTAGSYNGGGSSVESGESGSGSSSDSEMRIVIDGLAGTVSVMSQTMDELVARLDTLAAAVSDLTTKVDGLTALESESESGDESGDESEMMYDPAQISSDIDSLQQNVASLNSRIQKFEASGVAKDSVTELRGIVEQLQKESGNATAVMNQLRLQLAELEDNSAKELKRSIDGMANAMSSMKTELDRISAVLSTQGDGNE